MGEVIGSASGLQLLILIGMTLAGAVFFAAVIFFSSIRSRSKNKMKLGIQPGSTPPAAGSDMETPSPPPQSDLDISILSRQERKPALVSSHEEPGSVQNPLETQTENMEGNDVRRFDDNEEKINLAARLGSLSDPKPVPQPEYEELLRLLRHPETGQLVVEVAGRRYTRLTDVTDKKVGQYVLKLAAHLLAFTNGMVATDAGVKSVYYPKVKETPRPMPAAVSAPAAPGSPAAAAPAAKEVWAAEPSPASVAPARPNPQLSPLPSHQAPVAAVEEEKTQRRGLFGFARPTTSGPRLPMLNLAGQINEIVQARLQHSPLAANYKVEIRDDPGGGIQIYVNNITYSSPDDIPDGSIKELIKGAIREWEMS